MSDRGPAADRRASRRGERRELNRTEILDAAEKVFADHGVHDGSVRRIASEAGFSPAAIYLFFDNKQHLLYETLSRRGNEFIPLVAEAAAGDGDPMERLHGIVDVAISFFSERRNFARLLHRIGDADSILGSALADYAGQSDERFDDIMGAIAQVLVEGQTCRQINAGDPLSLARVYSVMVNEFVLQSTTRASLSPQLSMAEFHVLVDGAFRSRA